MKKILLSAGLLVVSHLVSAQINSFPWQGNVGIGASPATSILHVQGSGVIRPTFETISSISSIHDRPIVDLKKATEQ